MAQSDGAATHMLLGGPLSIDVLYSSMPRLLQVYFFTSRPDAKAQESSL